MRPTVESLTPEPNISPEDSEDAIARDVAAIGRISAVPAMLKIICGSTGMGFAAVARVTAGTWTACAVQDNIQFGLEAGGRLDVNTTLCMEARSAREPVVFDNASEDPLYRDHHTPRIYNIKAYISVPIILPEGGYFGNLCAIDPQPRRVSDEHTVTMFKVFAELIGIQLESEARQQATESELMDARTTAQLREQFIAVLGHDLRNPLNTVGIMAELLEQSDPVDHARIAKRLKSATRRMSRLIDDVLDFARGRMGQGLGMTMVRVTDLDSALHDVVAELRAAHPSREIREAIDVVRPVYCDRGRLQQMLSNLLANGLTHGAHDLPVGVDVHVDGEHLVMAVSNRGEPIAPENLDKVFHPYWRPASERPRRGLGLGLYICMQIVKAHAGNLHVTSSAEAGTRFTARIPVEPEA